MEHNPLTTAVLQACVDNNVAFLQQLIRDGANVDVVYDGSVRLDLDAACPLVSVFWKRREFISNQVLENFCTRTQFSSLGLAMAFGGDSDCALSLIEAGVSRGMDDGLGIELACLINAPLCVSALAKRGYPEKCVALDIAVVNGHMDCVRAILEFGVSDFQLYYAGCMVLGSRNKNSTPEMRLDCLLLLISAGFDLKDDKLHFSIRSGNTFLVTFLLERGLVPSGYDLSRCQDDDLKMVQTLLAYGAPRDEEPWQPASPEVSAFMELSSTWNTRLHFAEFLPVSRVRALLRNGADIHSRSKEADAPTPLDLARTRPHSEGSQLVIQASEPWSRVNHHLFPSAARKRVYELMAVGYMLERHSSFSVLAGAFPDVWERVMQYAISREYAFPAKYASVTDSSNRERVWWS